MNLHNIIYYDRMINMKGLQKKLKIKTNIKWISAFLITVIVLSLVIIPINTFAASSVSYTITLDAVENGKWTGTGGKTQINIKEKTGYKSVYIKPISSDYYVDSVYIEPAENANFTLNNKTGEVYIDNVIGDVTLHAVIKAKSVPYSLSLAYEFIPEQSRDAVDRAIQVSFTLTAKDQNGQPVPGAKVKFKKDSSESSYYYNGTTDNNGSLTITQSYGKGNYTAEAALFNGEELIDKALQEVNIIEQERLTYFPSYNLQHSQANQNNGAIYGLDDRFEYFTAPLTDGEYYNYGEGGGSWQPVTNGQITGLAPGTYGIRFKEYADYDNNTYYMSSFPVRLLIETCSYTVNIDIPDDLASVRTKTLYASQNGTIYLPITPEDGYEISNIYANYQKVFDINDNPIEPSIKSSNASYEDVLYNKEDNLIVITGITGNIDLTIKTEKILKPLNYSIVYVSTAGKFLSSETKSVNIWIKEDSYNLDNNPIELKPFDGYTLKTNAQDLPLSVKDGDTIEIKYETVVSAGNQNNPSTKSTSPETGENIGFIIFMKVTFLSSAAIVTAIIIRKRHKAFN